MAENNNVQIITLNTGKDNNYFYKSEFGMLHVCDKKEEAIKQVTENGTKKLVEDCTIPIYAGWPMRGDDAVMVDLQTMEAVKDNKKFDFKTQMPLLFEIAELLR